MVYKVNFEADVQGLASVKRIADTVYINAKDISTARHYMEGYIKDCYSEDYAILTVEPVYVIELDGAK